MDRRCWMLVISFVLTVPSLIGLACNKKDDHLTHVAIQAASGLRSDATGEATTSGSLDDARASAGDRLDKLGAESNSPEMKRFLEKAKANTDNDFDEREITAEASK